LARLKICSFSYTIIISLVTVIASNPSSVSRGEKMGYRRLKSWERLWDSPNVSSRHGWSQDLNFSFSKIIFSTCLYHFNQLRLINFKKQLPYTMAALASSFNESWLLAPLVSSKLSPSSSSSNPNRHPNSGVVIINCDHEWFRIFIKSSGLQEMCSCITF
jgi:hypothetical protein